ncbi:MAG: hypothetical protein ACSHYB_15490 [Roseibacillus sp.]
MSKDKAKNELAALDENTSNTTEGDLAIPKAIRHRIRYFSDGVLIGSKVFVDSLYHGSEPFLGPNITTGVRRPRGTLSPIKKQLYSVSDFSI